MIIGIPKETFAGERRVALVPETAQKLVASGHEVLVETGAGTAAGFTDAVYQEKGVRICPEAAEVYRAADVILWVRGLGANPERYREILPNLRKGQVAIGFLDPLGMPQAVRDAADREITVFSLELVPRITRAQNMDALSSMATIAGYKAVMIAADRLTRLFPMLMTAAGMIHPARVFVIGAGVTGLQAIATARRLGAVVQAYDLRAATRDEVQSLGAKFVELPLDTSGAEDPGGYARAMDEGFYRRQAELMARMVSTSDVVISTAQVPGKRAPVIITKEMVYAMAPGSVVVDQAAETGGNCELTKPGETIEVQGVTIVGEINLPSAVPNHASQLYSRNILNFLQYLTTKEKKIVIKHEDEIVRGTLVAQDGQVVHPRVRDLLGLEPLTLARPVCPPGRSE